MLRVRVPTGCQIVVVVGATMRPKHIGSSYVNTHVFPTLRRPTLRFKPHCCRYTGCLLDALRVPANVVTYTSLARRRCCKHSWIAPTTDSCFFCSPCMQWRAWCTLYTTPS